MKLMRKIALLLLTFMAAKSVTGQDVIQPIPPVLDRVSVDPQTGYTTIRWLASPSPDVGSYVIYTFSNNTAFAIDTLFSPSVTEYVHTGSTAKYMSVTYVVAAIDSSLNISPLSNSLSTVYLTAVNDTCNSAVTINWTPYINPAHPHQNYGLWVSINGGSAILHETLGTGKVSYVFTDTERASSYCFFVTATGNSGSLSYSNMQCIMSGNEKVPDWTSVDAVISGRYFIIHGSYDPASDIDKFVAQTYNTTTKEWSQSGSATGQGGSVSVPVTNADTNSVHLYRIAALNNCGKALVQSPPARNIVLSTSMNGTAIAVRWNNPFPSGPGRFSVWRNTGTDFLEIASEIADTAMTDDYTLFGEDVTAGMFSYVVTAFSDADPEVTHTFRSNISTLQSVCNIFVPNAFTPDGDGLNDIFIPRLSFSPRNYKFTIYTRTGVMIFQTDSHGTGWDGRHKGSLMPPGVYLWSLRLINPSGVSEQRKGTVTILP